MTTYSACHSSFPSHSQTSHHHLRQLPAMTTSSSSPAARTYFHHLTTYSTCHAQPSSHSHATHCPIVLTCRGFSNQQNQASSLEPNTLGSLAFHFFHSRLHPRAIEQSQSFPKLPLCDPKRLRAFLSFADTFFSNSGEPLQHRPPTPTSHRGGAPHSFACLRIQEASQTSSFHS